jgi:hypothetical protein
MKKPPRIAPDGVEFNIPWHRFPVGASVFIPCVNTNKAKSQVKAMGHHKLMRFITAVRIENKKYGLRIWRTV